MAGKLIGAAGRLGRDAPGNTGRLIRTPYPRVWNADAFKASSVSTGQEIDLFAVSRSTLWAAAVAKFDNESFTWSNYDAFTTRVVSTTSRFDEFSATRHYVSVAVNAITKDTSGLAGQPFGVKANVTALDSSKPCTIRVKIVESLPATTDFMLDDPDWEFDVSSTGELVCDCDGGELGSWLIVWPYITDMEPPDSYGLNIISINASSAIIIDP